MSIIFGTYFNLLCIVESFWGGLCFLSLQAFTSFSFSREWISAPCCMFVQVYHLCFWLRSVPIALHNTWEEPAGFSWINFHFWICFGKKKVWLGGLCRCKHSTVDLFLHFFSIKFPQVKTKTICVDDASLWPPTVTWKTKLLVQTNPLSDMEVSRGHLSNSAACCQLLCPDAAYPSSRAALNTDPSLVLCVYMSLCHWCGFSTPEQAQGLSHRKVSVVLLSLHHHPPFCPLCMCVHACVCAHTDLYVEESTNPWGFAHLCMHECAVHDTRCTRS